MSEWLEFKCITNDGDFDSEPSIEPVLIRSYSIRAIAKKSSESTTIAMDDDNNTYYIAAEPYEKVMDKVLKAEGPVDLSNCIVEHFSRDEYERILDAMNRLVGPSAATQKIIDKLEEILKEDKPCQTGQN